VARRLVPARRFGWIRDLPDHRDLFYAAPAHVVAAPPARADLTAQCPPVYDQGHLGSCTANAIAAALEFDRLKQSLPDFLPSRLFLYYNERALEGTVASDAGAQIRDGIKTVAKDGDCPEPEWPYVIEKFRTRPPARCYAHAASHRAVAYRRVVQDLSQLRGCLASGYPFVFGFAVYAGFMTPAVARTGVVPLPGPGESGPDGGPPAGHAVVAVGFDDARQVFLVRNSWGPRWGRKGYCTMPYAYLTHPGLAADFWTIRVVA